MRQTVLGLLTALAWVGPLLGQGPMVPQPVLQPQGIPPAVQPRQWSSALQPTDRREPLIPPQPRTPAPSAEPRAEELLRFDFRQVELRLNGENWQLLAGQVKLKDFGANETAGREAVRLIQDLRLTQYGAIGKPVPVMEYWLSDGRAPEGMLPQYSLVSFDPASLRVEPFQGQWFLRDAYQMLFTFGPHADAAAQALEVIRRHGFNQIGYVGSPVPVMMFFLANEDARTLRRATVPALAEQSNGGPPAARLQTRQLAQPALPLNQNGIPGERIPFDWRQAQLRRDQRDWKLIVGSYCLANFGVFEWEAREALRLVQHYRFTEFCRLGQGGTPFTYFLVNGQAPSGVPFGLHSVAFRPETLTVRLVEGNWTIYDGTQALLKFGAQVDEAHQAVQLMQRYQFDHLCQLGNPMAPALSFPVRER